jgi:hypothetical protein
MVASYILATTEATDSSEVQRVMVYTTIKFFKGQHKGKGSKPENITKS